MANALIHVPKTARAGEIITLSAMVSHPMETGYRRDISGAVIPRLILHSFTVTYDGAEIFEATFHPAVAANPFVQFTTIATKSGPITFLWIDDAGVTIQESVEITVTG
jgi:sulfur-oxidizing protein SoxZ